MALPTEPLPAPTGPWPDLPWPKLWHGRQHFSVLDTGGDQGLTRFLNLWQAWRHDPGRCGRLHVALLFDDGAQAELAWANAGTLAVSLDADLLTRLQATWPPLTPNLHPLVLDAGRVQLLLALGPLAQLLPRLRLQADVLCLSAAAAHAPTQRLRVLKAVARLAAPGSLACGAESSPELLAELRTAGFQQQAQGPAGQVWAHHRPYARARRAPPASATVSGPVPPPVSPPVPSAADAAGAEDANRDPGSPPRKALVIGAGVAGAAAAQALAQQGLTVTVLDRRAQPATETSGNPAALFHGTVNPVDGVYARLFRAAALVAQRAYKAACTAPLEEKMANGQVHGLLRLQPIETGPEPDELRQAVHQTAKRTPRPTTAQTVQQAVQQAVQQMQQQLQQLALPPDYVQALDPAQASALAGRPIAHPAWFFPGGGWIDPAGWVRQVLNGPGVQFQGLTLVHALQRQHGQWQALDAQGQVLAQADVLVLACGLQCQRLLDGLTQSRQWPLRQTRGQVTQLQSAGSQASAAAAEPTLRLPVAGDGYALPMSSAGTVLCGATRQPAVLHDRPGPFALQSQLAGGAGQESALPSPADHGLNLQRLQRLTGLQPQPGSPLLGRVGWRLHTDDRLPIAGAVPLPQPLLQAASERAAAEGSSSQPQVRVDHARRWPRWPGLFVLTALGARGLSLAPLLGRLVAAQAVGTAWPLEQELADAVDPVRWAVRAARLNQAQGQGQAKEPTGGPGPDVA